MKNDEDVFVHAPTLTASFLRAAASVVEVAAEQMPEETVFFPPKEDGEAQPVALEGYVELCKVGELIRYLADMLEA